MCKLWILRDLLIEKGVTRALMCMYTLLYYDNVLITRYFAHRRYFVLTDLIGACVCVGGCFRGRAWCSFSGGGGGGEMTSRFVIHSDPVLPVWRPFATGGSFPRRRATSYAGTCSASPWPRDPRKHVPHIKIINHSFVSFDRKLGAPPPSRSSLPPLPSPRAKIISFVRVQWFLAGPGGLIIINYTSIAVRCRKC